MMASDPRDKKRVLIVLTLYLVFMSGTATGIATQEDPFYSVGNDFMVVKNENNHPVIGSIFDNTTLWIDVENDGVWDYRFNRDRAENLDFRNIPVDGIIESGARIRADKPVIYQQILKKSRNYVSGSYIPSLSSLSSNYVSKGGDIVVPSKVNISVYYGDMNKVNYVKEVDRGLRSEQDFDSKISFSELRESEIIYLEFEGSHSLNDADFRNVYLELSNGTRFNLTINSRKSEYFNVPSNLKFIHFEYKPDENLKLNVYEESGEEIGNLDTFRFPDNDKWKERSIKPAKFARFSADRPFYLYKRDTVETPMGKRFYTPWEDVKIFAPYSNTTVKVDKNNDRHFDRTLDLENLESAFSLEKGAYLVSNKPVRVYYRIEEGYVAAPPANMIGSDLWISSPAVNFRKAATTGIFRTKTNISRDDVEDLGRGRDGFSEIDVTTGSRQEIIRQNNIHLRADKPIISTLVEDRSDVEFNGNMFPYSKITTLHRNKQKYLAGNEISPMEVRVMNPFYNTTIENLEMTVNVNKEFEIPDPDKDGQIAVNVQKFDLNNDTAESGEQSAEVSYSSTSDGTEFSVDQSDLSHLDKLESLRYLELEYFIETPASLGTYRFDPVEVDYDAKTWKMPSEKGP